MTSYSGIPPTPDSRVVGSVQQIADAAYVYCAARQVVKEEARVSTAAMAQVDAALHDLTLCCGFPCTTCADGTCPGLILS